MAPHLTIKCCTPEFRKTYGHVSLQMDEKRKSSTEIFTDLAFQKCCSATAPGMSEEICAAQVSCVWYV
jgi:hypothetical protein